MNETVEYRLNKASAPQIAEHLSCCDADFMPSLSSRVEIGDYANKIACRATRFEAWVGDTLIGLVAAYLDDLESRLAYITSVSVLREWTGKGVAACLVGQCVEQAKALGMHKVSLEVAEHNKTAIKLYERSGFIASKTHTPFIGMSLWIDGNEHEQQT